ncbi:hypothetical protein F5X99DRAFT_206601 [Biscogniauxia marginata]|nr:hypothetical protein F5X99DRAFT_206601 [Biscogniauxia marginata]
MSTPTLPASWTPTQAGCLRTGDYWIWEYNMKAGDARTVLGGPTQISACFPSTWDASLTYAGTACPPQYTSACQDADSGAVTCCPTAYPYSCQAPTWSPGVHGEMFRCVSQYGTTGTMVVTQTDFAVNTLTVQTRNMQSTQHLFALAVMYAEPTSTASSLGQTLTASSSSLTSSSAPNATTEPMINTSGLNSGQIAGVAVGVAAAGFVIGFVAWYLFRRRKYPRGPTHSGAPSELIGSHSRAPSSRRETATELASEDPMPWEEAVKHPWQIKPS